MRHLIPLLLATTVFAQVPPANPGFEAGDLRATPPGWNSVNATARITGTGCQNGKCVEITAAPNLPADRFGNLMQVVPAESYRLRRVRMRASMRVTSPRTRVQ